MSTTTDNRVTVTEYLNGRQIASSIDGTIELWDTGLEGFWILGTDTTPDTHLGHISTAHAVDAFEGRF